MTLQGWSPLSPRNCQLLRFPNKRNHCYQWGSPFNKEMHRKKKYPQKDLIISHFQHRWWLACTVPFSTFSQGVGRSFDSRFQDVIKDVEESAKMRLLQMVNLKFRPKGKKHQAGRWHIVAFTGKSWRLNNFWQMSKHQEYGDIVNECSNPLAIGFFDGL